MASREPWWAWHWDKSAVAPFALPMKKITRWRCGSLLTIYRQEQEGDTLWWFYGPFNIGIGVSIPSIE